MHLLFESIIEINMFIDFSPIKCGFYSRAAFNRINTVCALDVIENASIDLRPHYRLMRFPLSTLKRSETIELNVVILDLALKSVLIFRRKNTL